MPSSVSEETLRAAAAEYAAGLATLDRRLAELAQEHERLVADKRVTLGAKFAVDRLLESLAPTPTAAPAAPIPPPARAPATSPATPSPATAS